MDFITEFNRFIDGLPINTTMRKQIKDYVHNLVVTDQHTEPTIEQLAGNVVNAFVNKPDVDPTMALEYTTYILNKAIAIKNTKVIEKAIANTSSEVKEEGTAVKSKVTSVKAKKVGK